MNERWEASVERLVSRDDVWLTRRHIEEHLRAGRWTEETFLDLVSLHAAQKPNAPAVIDEDGAVTTYGELEKASDQFALGLQAMGVCPGDRVALQLPNTHEFLVALMGTAKAGAISVLCHMPYTEHDLAYVLQLTQPKVAVVMATFRNRDYLAPMRRAAADAGCTLALVAVPQAPDGDAVSYADLLRSAAEGAGDSLHDTRPVAVDPFFIMFTSGTTGRPKAELHLHANNLYWIRQLNQTARFEPAAKWLIVTPIAHLTGLGIGCLGALSRGAPVALLSHWDVQRAVSVMRREQPTYLLGATPMLVDLARADDLTASSVPYLRGIVYAGATCPAEILRSLNAKLGADIFACYGYTEGGVTHITRPGDGIDVTSVSFGKRLDGLEDQVVDERGQRLEPPCEGELWVRGANMIPGYYRQPENTRRMFDDDGWFHSADIVRVDEAGYSTFVARRDDLINRGGYKIDPRAIEEVLYAHPRVGQAAVVAMPDPRLGQRAACFIVPKHPGDVLTLEEVQAFLRDRGVSKSHWPEAVQMIDSFPMTSTGKFQRFALREIAARLRPGAGGEGEDSRL
ncbi:class I adenylate-forming enzyme family protein [Alicyclobacillus mali (ex Roth et al. 2021)]|uniref:class I adenylate-forming enzyme family protein n=1 Tax=Alicyclobacillus mali (ex Roth et al. 2021) TaxID=1123961 RepID=UPI0008365793|nr:class I adenylate-forming enzyme family protein [Alicyclobacillus mali (ex Roth et al. 2021)]